ncbi:hypothetical protein GH714_022413 [Hevea brasiliensis]|uniref:Pentacotripeptide-repeat region of PRORP domain-containing protein n=1 Tax=Hevea brasiliensis TaxID=3981 RepID=A0A6A6NIK8_HEVBR|nr:hypothetical protein GH714_022413 [Hevea brasiliensis]
MSKRRGSLVLINSLTVLSKVRSSSKSSYSIKTIALSKNLSTAVDRSEFQNSVGYHLDNSDEHFQNPNGAFDESQNPIELVQKPNGHGLNTNWGFRESTGNVTGNIQVAQNGNPGGSYGQNHGNFLHNLNGDYQNFNGSCWESTRVDQNNPNQWKGDFSGYHVNTGQFQHTNREVSALNSKSSQDHLKGVYGGSGKPNVHGYYHEAPREVRQTQLGFICKVLQGHKEAGIEIILKMLISLRVAQVVITWEFGMYQHGASAGQYQQNLNVGQYQPNLNGVNNLMQASQLSSAPNVEGESAEPSETSPYRGTLEDLDDFCKERKMKEAVEVLCSLEEQRVTLDLPRFLQLMQACGETKALEEAKAVHDHIMRSLLPLEVDTYNKILEMYAKCGSMDKAFDVFDKMPERNLNSWDTMITWLAKHGLGEDAIDLFSQFKQAGLEPDAQMYIGVFSACGDVGDVNEGMLHFESMMKDYGIVPSMEHYVSIVDMLGSTGIWMKH